MTSKLIDDTFRPPRDPLVTLGFFGSSSSSSSACSLQEAHRLIEEEMKREHQRQKGEKEEEEEATDEIESEKKICSEQIQSLQNEAVKMKEEYAHVKRNLVSLFGPRVVLLGSQQEQQEEEESQETEERKNRRACVESEVLVGVLVTLNARKQQISSSSSNGMQKQRRQRELLDSFSSSSSSSSSSSFFEACLGFPEEYGQALQAETFRERTQSSTSRKQIFSSQTMRRDLHRVVGNSVLPSLKNQTQELRVDLQKMKKELGED